MSELWSKIEELEKRIAFLEKSDTRQDEFNKAVMELVKDLIQVIDDIKSK